MIDILELIPEGTEQEPVTRESLMFLTGLSDRAVRNEIKAAKRQKPIVNVGNGPHQPESPFLQEPS